MYKLESFSPDGALVTHSSMPYRAVFIAADAAEADDIVVGLNKPEMLATLADVRYQVETAGLMLEDGLRILTDRESRAELYNTYTALKNGLMSDTDWKAANGWKVVTIVEMEPITRAMAAHVRGCYAGERLVVTAINEATTMIEIEAINIESQFNQAYQRAINEVMSAAQAAE